MQNKDWLKFKSYTHLTPKTSSSQSKWIRSYVSDTEKVKSHRFYPMIHYTLVDKRFRRNRVNGVKESLRTAKPKKREIFYSNHLDSHVYSYYAKILNELLDAKYENDKDLNEAVIAYRKIPFNNNRNKNNIDFAHEVFSHIRDSNSKKLTAMCMDVSSYFDSINHKILKKLWAQLLNRFDLPDDHYKVYRAITKFSFIEIGDIFELSPNYKIGKLIYLKNKSLDGFFDSGEQFRNMIKDNKIIKINRKDFGIPQGSAISATLSNLYLYEFDKLMIKLSKLYNGFYRRYSDDIVFVCDPQWVNKVNETVKQFLTDDLKLTIQDEKTQWVNFERESAQKEWQTTLNENGVKYKNRPLTYLGFDFDGQNIRIKQKSISSYYRKLKRSIRRAAFFANKIKEAHKEGRLLNRDAWIYRTRIYKLKTHLGSRKKTIDNKIYWGNFLSYAYNSSRIMKEPGIKKQMRNHWRIVESEINRMNRKYGLLKSTSDNNNR